VSELHGILSAHVDAVWHLAVPFIERALRYGDGEYLPQDIKDRCKSQDMQLWLFGDGTGVKGAGVTRIAVYPCRKYLDLTYWASDAPFEEFGPHLKTIEAWAESLGATPRIFGREGWKKKLPAYQRRYSVFVRTS
jgi:hypothetical protein